MNNSKNTYPDTLPRIAVGQCPVCGSAGSLVHFQGETFPVSVGDLSGTVTGMSGDRCQECEEVFLDDDSDRRFAASGDELVTKHRQAEGEIMKAARKKLGLTQHEVALLVGGGHNGVSRYEKGIAAASPAAFNLLHLLSSDPLLAAHLPGVSITKVDDVEACKIAACITASKECADLVEWNEVLTTSFVHNYAVNTGSKVRAGKGVKIRNATRPKKVINVSGERFVINVNSDAVHGARARAIKRIATSTSKKTVDVGSLVAARAAAEKSATAK